MFGLIYADYKDTSLSHEFHRYACTAFHHIALRHHEHILALTDPSVTATNLSLLLAKCNFIFYWGHGEQNSEGDFNIYGSTGKDRITFSYLSTMLYQKTAYIDACGLGDYLTGRTVKDCTLICPRGLVDYPTSVKVGCSTMLRFLSRDKSLAEAFQDITELTSTQDIYTLFSDKSDIRLDIPENARLSLVECFSDILHAWSRYPQEHSYESEGR